MPVLDGSNRLGPPAQVGQQSHELCPRGLVERVGVEHLTQDRHCVLPTVEGSQRGSTHTKRSRVGLGQMRPVCLDRERPLDPDPWLAPPASESSVDEHERSFRCVRDQVAGAFDIIEELLPVGSDTLADSVPVARRFDERCSERRSKPRHDVGKRLAGRGWLTRRWPDLLDQLVGSHTARPSQPECGQQRRRS